MKMKISHDCVSKKVTVFVIILYKNDRKFTVNTVSAIPAEIEFKRI